MKSIVLISALFLLPVCTFSRSVELLLTNKTTHELQVFSQIMDEDLTGNPEFVVQLRPGGKKMFAFKMKRGQKLKITGYGGGTETLPIVKSFDQLTGEHLKVELVLPKVEKIEPVELTEVLSRVKNDNWLGNLLDTARYSEDQLPILGSFVFYNHRDKSTISLLPTYWKNTKEKRSVNNQYFERTDYINSSNAAGLKVSGIPFLKSLGSAFSNASMVEVRWKVNNAHIEQWQPSDKNPFEIIQDPVSAAFLEACVAEMTSKNLGAGDYSLYFISSAMVTDNIYVSAKRYTKVAIKADVDFAATDARLEVIKPVGIDADYSYTREKGYSMVDSSCNIYLKFLAQDYTLLLNSHINKAARTAQKQSAVKTLDVLKNSIVEQYQALSALDPQLLQTRQLEVILPIVGITEELVSGTVAAENSPGEQHDDDRKAAQFNALLKETKNTIAQYKSTVESIQKLDQSKDYHKLLNSISTVEIDDAVIDAYVRSKG